MYRIIFALRTNGNEFEIKGEWGTKIEISDQIRVINHSSDMTLKKVEHIIDVTWDFDRP